MEKIWLKSYDQGIPPSLKYPDVPIHELLKETARIYPEEDAILFMGHRIPYSRLMQYINLFASTLEGIGIKRGDRVMIHLPNTPHAVISYYAILKIGAVVVNSNPLYTEKELEFQVNDSGAETIIVLDLKIALPKVKGLIGKTDLRNIILCSVQDFLPFPKNILFPIAKRKLIEPTPPLPGYYRFMDLIKKGSDLRKKEEVNMDDLAVLQYTGGTTGMAKGAMLTHRNLVVNALQAKTWGSALLEEGNERILTVLPLFHSFAMTAAMNHAALSGFTLILVPKFELEDLLRTIKKYRPTLFPGVPTIYTAIANHKDVRSYGVDSIKICNSGAAPLPLEVFERFEAVTGAKILEGYGLSETSPVSHCNPLLGEKKIGSVGIPVPDTEMKIVDIETGEKELDVGQIGEICIRGPQVMKGYWKREEETSAVLRDGWLYTGDIGKVDEDGYLYIVDRKKEMIISGGFNIYPREVEEVLYSNPAVIEAAVIGVPDEYKGEAIKAFVVLKEGMERGEEELREFCRKSLAPYKVPKYIEFRDTLPKSLIGKVLRRELKEEELRLRGQGRKDE